MTVVAIHQVKNGWVVTMTGGNHMADMFAYDEHPTLMKRTPPEPLKPFEKQKNVHVFVEYSEVIEFLKTLETLKAS